ncbi:Uncharacterised protein [Candidatus Tiddalikarchaeum anstoanum]|nr:Uncharacterised protein [Candidatus Tiddalikarchaeum anstoanum]
MQPSKDIVTINIGKEGLTESVVEHVKLLLKQHGQIKLKFLKSANFDAGVLENKVIKKIGKTMILQK